MIDVRIGDSRVLVHDLVNNSIDCCVTSPPYWGLRDYKTESIIYDGSPDCQHEWGIDIIKKQSGGINNHIGNNCDDRIHYESTTNFCFLCGAWRGQFGLEPTPELYLKHLWDFFDDVKLKLKDTGNCFVNLGDTFYGSPSNSNSSNLGNATALGDCGRITRPKHQFLQPKSLCCIPSRFAWGMIERGWILRNEIIWNKGNHMPESVTDRLTKAHEVVYHFVKSDKPLLWKHDETNQWIHEKPIPDYIWENKITTQITKTEPLNWKDNKEEWSRKNLWCGFDYYYNLDAIREPHLWKDRDKRAIDGKRHLSKGKSSENQYSTNNVCYNLKGKNPGDVWSINTSPFSGAHFAVFPLELVRRPILAGCPEGGTVFDPFAGSGTVGEFCRHNNRNAILFDLNPEYKQLIDERAMLSIPRLDSYSSDNDKKEVI